MGAVSGNLMKVSRITESVEPEEFSMCDKMMSLHVADDLEIMTEKWAISEEEQRAIDAAIAERLETELRQLPDPQAQFLLLSVRRRIASEDLTEPIATLVATPRPSLESDTWRELLIHHFVSLDIKVSEREYGGKYVASVEEGLSSATADDELMSLFFSFGDLLNQKGMLFAI
jgi:hypothetical protein